MSWLKSIICLLLVTLSLIIDPRVFIGLFIVMYFSGFFSNTLVMVVILSLSIWIVSNINFAVVGLILISAILIDVLLKTRFNFIALRVIYFSVFWLIFFKYLGYGVLNVFSAFLILILVFVIYVIKRLFISRDSNGIFINHEF